MFNIANKKSTTRFQRAIDEVRMLPLTPPKGGSKSEFVVLWIKFKFKLVMSATKFLCVKRASEKCSIITYRKSTVSFPAS